MALPKYKTSRANTRMRRSTWKTQATTTISCPNCGAPTMSHVACPNCGSYRGRVYREAIRDTYAR